MAVVNRSVKSITDIKSLNSLVQLKIPQFVLIKHQTSNQN